MIWQTIAECLVAYLGLSFLTAYTACLVYDGWFEGAYQSWARQNENQDRQCQDGIGSTRTGVGGARTAETAEAVSTSNESMPPSARGATVKTR